LLDPRLILLRLGGLKAARTRASRVTSALTIARGLPD
jgi:hypothetical protein